LAAFSIFKHKLQYPHIVSWLEGLL